MAPIDETQKAVWLKELQLNGFVILRNFLPVDFVVELHDQLLPLLKGEYTKAVAGGFERGRAPGRLAIDLERYAELLGGPLADERYRRNPLIEELVDAVLGAGGWRRGWSLVEAVWKGSAFMSWHSDQTLEETPDPDGPHEPVRLTYNIPLIDTTWAVGATEFLPGSHTQPRSFLNQTFHDVAQVYPVRPLLRRGDAMLRDGNGLHRGTPNLTDDPRPMLDQTYKKV